MIFLALGAWAGLLALTPFGVGLSRDSSVYFDLASNLARAHHYVVSVPGGSYLVQTHFPPLYPAILSILSMGGLSLFTAARLLGAALLALNLYLGMLILYRVTARDLLAVLCFAFFWGTHFITTTVHAMAWSEPLALLLAQGAIYLWVARPAALSVRRLTGIATLLSLAVLTRYAALAYAGAMGIVILIEERPRSSRAWRGIALAILLGALPLILWILHNLIMVGEMTDRLFILHAAALGPAFRQFIYTVSSWVFPESWYSIGRWIALAIIGFAFWPHRAGSLTPSARSLLRFCRVFAVTYLALLILTIALFDAETPMDARILFPLQSAFWMSLLLQIKAFWMAQGARLPRAAYRSFALVALAFALLQGFLSVSRAQLFRTDAMQYGSLRWRESAMLKTLRENPPPQILYCNLPEVVTLYSNTSAYVMPDPQNAAPMLQAIREKRAVLVLLDSPEWPLAPIDARLTALFGLKPLVRTSDGVIYGI